MTQVLLETNVRTHTMKTYSVAGIAHNLQPGTKTLIYNHQ